MVLSLTLTISTTCSFIFLGHMLKFLPSIAGALSDVNSLYNEGPLCDGDDTSVSSRASSRIFDDAMLSYDALSAYYQQADSLRGCEEEGGLGCGSVAGEEDGGKGVEGGGFRYGSVGGEDLL